MSFPPKSVIVSPPEVGSIYKGILTPPPVSIPASTTFDDVGTSIAHQCIVKVRSNDISILLRVSLFTLKVPWFTPISSRASYQNQQSCYNPLQWDEGHCPLAARYVIPVRLVMSNVTFLRTATLSSDDRYGCIEIYCLSNSCLRLFTWINGGIEATSSCVSGKC